MLVEGAGEDEVSGRGPACRQSERKIRWAPTLQREQAGPTLDGVLGRKEKFFCYLVVRPKIPSRKINKRNNCTAKATAISQSSG